MTGVRSKSATAKNRRESATRCSRLKPAIQITHARRFIRATPAGIHRQSRQPIAPQKPGFLRSRIQGVLHTLPLLTARIGKRGSVQALTGESRHQNNQIDGTNAATNAYGKVHARQLGLQPTGQPRVVSAAPG